ncbi:MAG: DUF962 domain-containing protein [Cellvibrionaceae bacterium]
MPTKTLEDWFNEYGESHINPTNQLIHNFAVPIIYITIMGLLWDLPWPEALSGLAWLNWSILAVIITGGFFIRYSITLTLGIIILSAIGIALCLFVETAGIPVWLASIVVFIIAWVFQFIGHKIEGKKPSFFKDLQYLLVGPGWVLAKWYRKLGIKL